jgi:hypothetical protein
MPPKFDWTTPWSAFHRQFEAAADNNGWTPSAKADHLLNVLQGWAVDILQSVLDEATYEDIVEALKDSYADLQPAAAYRSQLKARTQANGAAGVPGSHRADRASGLCRPSSRARAEGDCLRIRRRSLRPGNKA